jgi:hypothetical protein
MKKFYSPSAMGFYLSGFHSAIPSDAIEITEEQHKILINGGGRKIEVIDGAVVLSDREISDDEKNMDNINSIQIALDNKAKERGYNSIQSACSYASAFEIIGSDPISKQREKYRVEGNALQSWMGEVWATIFAYSENASHVPTKEEIISLIPSFEWPE